MSEKNITKKQHFIPQFYLKLFTNRDNFLQVLDVENNRLCRPKPVSGVGYEKYFYAKETGILDEVSQDIEKWLQAYEDFISKEVLKIINKILDYKQINSDDRYVLSSLICMLWLRSPGMRKQLNRMNEDMTKKMISFRATANPQKFFEKEKGLSEEEKQQLFKMIKENSYNLSFNNVPHLKFMTSALNFGGPGFINLFFAQKWKIYIIKGDYHFITSDSPVVEWWLPPKTFYGADFLSRNKYFALTPKILIELTFPAGSEKVKRETIFEDNNEKLKIFNILITANAQQFVYSSKKNIIEELISGRQNPGETERKYYIKYELPWEEERNQNKTQKNTPI